MMAGCRTFLTLQLSFLLLGHSLQHSEFCEVANVHIEHEDGSEQVFEVKRLQPVTDDCATRTGCLAASKFPRVAALHTNIRLTVGELVDDCGT